MCIHIPTDAQHIGPSTCAHCPDACLHLKAITPSSLDLSLSVSFLPVKPNPGQSNIVLCGSFMQNTL